MDGKEEKWKGEIDKKKTEEERYRIKPEM